MQCYICRDIIAKIFGESQEIDLNTADMRKLMNFCLPEVSQCPTSIDTIVKIYRDADL